MNYLNDTDSYSDYEEGEFAKLAFSILSPLKSKKSIKPDHFTLWSDDEFHYRFRLLKSTVRFVFSLVKEHLEVVEDVDADVLPEQQLLFALRYLATGSLSKARLDFVGIRSSTSKLIAERVCEVLAFLRSRIVSFPKCRLEMRKVEKEFFGVAKFPHCVGVIGCTHVKLTTVDARCKNMDAFKNANNFYSLKVQIVCDANSKIQNIVARWPGSAQSSRIFFNSKLRKLFEEGEMNGKVILGDSGYPLRKYLLTPVNNAAAASTVKYNEALANTRRVLSSTCDTWKRRFPILIVGPAGNNEWVQCIVVATAVLHNVACNMGDRTPKVTAQEQEALKAAEVESKGSYVNENNEEHAATRDLLVEYFGRISPKKCN